MLPWESGSSAGNKEDYELAITGKAFEFMLEKRDNADPEDNQPASIIRRIVRNARVFARMSPENKAQLIVELQNETGEIIAM